MLDVTIVSEFTKEADLKKDNPPESPRCKKVAAKANKKKNRKGGLSMFLTGALDDNPKPVVAPPPPKPKNEGPAWGGAAKVVSKGYSSLRDIQDEQSKTPQPHEPVRTAKLQLGDESCGKTEGKILLSSFLTSKPIPVESTRSLQQSDVERGTPPWASSATPPHVSRPSLRDIQMQQVRLLLCFGKTSIETNKIVLLLICFCFGSLMLGEEATVSVPQSKDKNSRLHRCNRARISIRFAWS